MDGNMAFEKQIREKIDSVLSRNPDKKYLRGFKSFISAHSSVNTTFNYVDNVKRFMEYSGNIEPEALRLEDYTEYLEHVKTKTSSYQITVYTALKKFSMYLSASGVNERNSMQYVSRPKAKESLKTRLRREEGYLSTEEISAYISAVKDYDYESAKRYGIPNWRTRDLLIILLLLSTGMRCSALYKLNIDSIDYLEGTLITVDKGDKVAEYELPENVIEAALDYLVVRDEVLERKNTHTDALFVNQYGQRLGQQSIDAVVKKFGYAVPGKKLSPHKLRATYGTQLYEKTHDLYFVQKCMGHASSKVTEIYIRGQKSQNAQKAKEIISSIISE